MDRKWEQYGLNLEKAILVLNRIVVYGDEGVDVGEAEEARNALLSCMFMDTPSNIFSDALYLYNIENNDE